MSPPVALADGLLAGRYALCSRIATGGMGEVWRATDVVLDRAVAVKMLKAEYVDDPEFRARFRAEARHAAGLSHPGIASVFDYGEQDDAAGRSAWLVMELVPGRPLSEVLRDGPLDVATALDVIGQTALALDVAHRAGVVHRDVKPGNLMVRPDGVVKVTDFGIAHAAGAAPLTRTGTVVGTAYYLAPEQALGQVATPAGDIYSLGVVAHECLTGTRPFPGTNPMAVAAAHLHAPPPPLPEAVPGPVRDLVAQSLAKDPADRPASAAELGRWALTLREQLSEGRSAWTGALESGSSEAASSPATSSPARSSGAGSSPAGSSGADPRPGHLARPVRRPTPAPGRRHHRAVGSTLALLAVLVLGLAARTWTTPSRLTVATLPAGVDAGPAAVQLQDQDLRTSQRNEPSSTAPAGQVLRTDPVAGTQVRPGDLVLLDVSSGPAAVTVDAAALLGRPYVQVRNLLVTAGLVPVRTDDGVGTPVGTVSAVEPSGQVAAGSPVAVHVAPEPVAPVPNAAAAPTGTAATGTAAGGGPVAAAPSPAPAAAVPTAVQSAPAAAAPAPPADPGAGQGQGHDKDDNKDKGGKDKGGKDKGRG